MAGLDSTLCTRHPISFSFIIFYCSCDIHLVFRYSSYQPPTGRNKDTMADDDEPPHISHFRAVNEGSATGSSNLTGSVRAQAMAIHADSTRSIGGRLGGHFDSSRSIPSTAILSDLVHADHPPTEGTSLVSIPSMSVMAEVGPPLTKWILPALSCAAAYAFYNVSCFFCMCCVTGACGTFISVRGVVDVLEF